MTKPTNAFRIAYLAPELPALSATFVYEELLALERRGIPVVPFSVHRPVAAVPGHEPLARRTQVLYDGAVVPAGFAAMFRFGARAFTALQWLVADIASVGVLRLSSWKLVYQWLAGARLARHLRRSGCSHLHIHFAHVPAQIGMYASAFAGVPYSVMAHANDIFERGFLLRQKAQRAAKMLTISEYNLAYLRSVGVDEGQVAVVRCGVSFPPPPRVPGFEKRESYRLGTLGRLVEKKGVDVLLGAMVLLRDVPWRWELCIAGDGPLRPTLEAQARELGIAQQVRFVGALAHHEVSAWLRELDSFVLACRHDANGDMDGIPVVLMEAMSQGVPVVSTRLSGIPELVIHERTGLLAMPNNPESLALEIRRLLESPALRQRLAVAGMHHAEAEFGQAVNIDRLLLHVKPPATIRQSSPVPVAKSS